MNVFEHDHTFHHGFPRRSCFLDFCHFKIDEFLTTNEPRLDTVYDVDNRAHIHGTALTTVLLKFNVSLYGMICQMNIIIKIVKIEILAFFQFKLGNGQNRKWPIFEYSGPVRPSRKPSYMVKCRIGWLITYVSILRWPLNLIKVIVKIFFIQTSELV